MSQAASDRREAEAEMEVLGWERTYPFANGKAWWIDPMDVGPEREPVSLWDAVMRQEGRDAAVREVMEW